MDPDFKPAAASAMPSLGRSAYWDDHGRKSFTLIELIVVLGIIVLILGMIDSMLGLQTIKGSQVKAAAEQLSSVLRKARQMAMDHKGFYGVSFNIQNAPGSTGAVLNNRSGGHWYRIIGPHDTDIQGGWSSGGGYSLPYFFSRSISGSATGDTELSGWLSAIQRDFIGEKYVLPQGQARFIALTDEDNGNNWTPYSRFGPTYPRPWFGDFIKEPWDSNPRFYAWGGYDSGSNFLDNFGSNIYWRALRPSVNYTGFYYQGDDSTIVGCVNPNDRYIVNNPGSTIAITDPKGATSQPGETFALFTQGQGRPLINGNWLDCVILFNPDGTASMTDWMSMRHQYGNSGEDQNSGAYWNDTQNKNLTQLGPGDMCNYESPWCSYYAAVPYNNRFEASNYSNVTGTYYITIGGDAPNDTVQFPTAQAALDSMLPLYRVSVSKLGEVKVVKVQTKQPANVTLDPKWKSSVWTTGDLGFNGYYNNLALSAAGEQLMPAEDFVTPTMMTNQQWWIDPTP